MKKKITIVQGLAVLLLWFLIAVPQGDARAATLRYAVSTFGEENLDPTLTSIVSALGVGGPLWDWLTELTPEGELRPSLATTWSQVDDGKAWELDLRNDVTFHDGSPMTAEDVRFTLLTFASERSRSSRAPQFRKKIADVKAIGPYKVRLELASPWPTLPYDLSNQAGMEGIVLPKAFIERVGWEAFAQHPVGTGAWKFVGHKVGDVVEFEANKNYWSTPPKFDRLSLLLVPEEATRAAMLQSEQADIADISVDSASGIEQKGFKIIADPQFSSIRVHLYGTYSDKSMPTSDVRVRKALNLAINRDELLAAFFNGRGRSAASFPIATLSIGYPKDLAPYPFDPEEAKRLLSEAGYPDGFEITLFSMPVSGFTLHQQTAEAVAGYWEAIGVRTRIIPTDFGAFRPLYVARPVPKELVGQASIFASTGRLNGSDDLRIWWLNEGGVVHMAAPGEIDPLYADAMAATTVEDLASAVSAAYHTLYQSYRGIPLIDAVGAIWAYGNQIDNVEVGTFRGYITPTLKTAVPAQ
ncbi:MAG: ABC transporter substrate-binding protein [Hyphomicrobiales bacterium]|nr:ABC transporter substrate-binding protein [Hyphomicrobiales bacterium]